MKRGAASHQSLGRPTLLCRQGCLISISVDLPMATTLFWLFTTLRRVGLNGEQTLHFYLPTELKKLNETAA